MLNFHHKTGTNLGIGIDNEIDFYYGIISHLDELKNNLSAELFNKNIKNLRMFLTWLNENYDVEIDEAEEVCGKIADLISEARQKVAATINVAMVYTYFEIGRMIVEEEQQGKERAGYAKS